MNYYSTIFKRVGIATAILIILSITGLLIMNALFLYNPLTMPAFFQQQGFAFDRFQKPVYIECIENGDVETGESYIRTVAGDAHYDVIARKITDFCDRVMEQGTITGQTSWSDALSFPEFGITPDDQTGQYDPNDPFSQNDSGSQNGQNINDPPSESIGNVFELSLFVNSDGSSSGGTYILLNVADQSTIVQAGSNLYDIPQSLRDEIIQFIKSTFTVVKPR